MFFYFYRAKSGGKDNKGSDILASVGGKGNKENGIMVSAGFKNMQHVN
jgi:hypothetical protein